MKAAVCREFRKPLSIEELSLVDPGPGELRVSVKACGICHSDITYMEGAWGGELPAVFGHEVAGTVDELGEGVELKVGQPVIVSLIRACGRCPQCVTGQPALCSGASRLHPLRVLTDANGDAVNQGLQTAGFAESILVHASQAVPIPADVSLEAACLVACAVMTGFGAAVNTARVMPGQSVVVIGTGGIGVNALQGAAIAGAHPVIAVDVRDEKLEVAKSFGATHTVNGRDDAAEEAVRALTDGRRPDLVIVAAGSGEAVEQGLRMAGRAGTVVVVGMPGGEVTSRLATMMFAYYGQRILGSKMGSAQPRVDVPRLISLYKEGRLKLDEMITGRYPLDRINDAIASSKRGEGVRNVIVFPG